MRERLDRHAERCGETGAEWEQLVKSAYLARVNLSASGFYMYVLTTAGLTTTTTTMIEYNP